MLRFRKDKAEKQESETVDHLDDMYYYDGARGNRTTMNNDRGTSFFNGKSDKTDKTTDKPMKHSQSMCNRTTTMIFFYG